MATACQLAYRTSKLIGVVEAAPKYTPLPGFKRPEGNLRCCVYSPCGRYLAWASVESVTIVDASTGQIMAVLPTTNVFEIGFSPLGTFVITWQRPSKDENGDACKNLKVWRVVEEEPESRRDEDHIVGQFVQKSQTGWNLQYTCNESYCARVVTNEVQLYESSSLSTVWSKLRAEGVSDFAVSPGHNQSIAIFIPERKGQPAAVKIYNVPKFSDAVSQKTFFKGDKVQLKWNNEGSSLIVLAQTEVDKSGKSYYGETTLYLMSANGSFDSRIDLDKDGPIHDVTWSPNSKEFGVVYGYMPAKTTLFNARAIATYNFPLGPRNTIIFSPHGTCVLVAGFGNLAGQMDVYDLQRNYRKLCTIEASNASLCEWSPNGNYILTATTSPRLRVDNGLRLWHAGGALLYNEDLNELYHVAWRPQVAISSPPADAPQETPVPHESALKYLGAVKTPSKPAGAYRPPGARGQVTPLAFRREDEGGAAYVSNGSMSSGLQAATFGKPKKREIPGAEVVGVQPAGGVAAAQPVEGDFDLSKTAAKNKKKREAKKAKDAGAKANGSDLLDAEKSGFPDSGENHSPARSPHLRPRKGHEHRDPRAQVEGGSSPQHNSRERYPNGSTPALERRPSAQEKGASQLGQVAISEAPSSTSDFVSGGGSTHDKKVRALLKKLRAIDDLRMRRAGGEKLENTQLKKMETEDDVRKELQELGWTE